MPILKPQELRARLSLLFSARGLEAQESERLADILVATESAGRRTHGLIRVRSMLRQLEKSGHSPGVWLRQSAVSALYDGRDGLGYLVAWHTADKAIELASRSGLALAGARGATHTGPLSYYAGMCAEAGLIGLAFTDCSPLAAPFGGTSAVLGTNPVAFSFPRPGAPPLIVDFGTTAVTWGEARLASQEGRELPVGVALDNQGHPTTNPGAAISGGAFLPFGGHKGFALALAIQVLTTALTGAAAVPDTQVDYGFTVIALKPDLLVPAEQYESTLEELLRRVKASPAANPERPVRLPGERSNQCREISAREGIVIPDKLYANLFGAAD